MKYIITGSNGFIATHMCNLLASKEEEFYTIDNKSAGSNNFETAGTKTSKKFYEYDLCDARLYEELQKDFESFKNVIVCHFAAKSHVDLSIKTPVELVTSNIQSTYTIAEFCAKNNIPFVNIGTDEVYGSLTESEMPFNTSCQLSPRNPYSASKAVSEILIESLIAQYPNWQVIRTRCVNNFGEYQDYSKLIPVCVDCILNNRKIPVYGNGMQKRTWIDVAIHNQVIYTLIQKAFTNNNGVSCSKARVFNIGSQYEYSNIEIIDKICKILDKNIVTCIEHIEDPRGHAHDFRYALDSRQTEQYIGSQFDFNFDARLKAVVEWYKQYLPEKEKYWKASAK